MVMQLGASPGNSWLNPRTVGTIVKSYDILVHVCRHRWLSSCTAVCPRLLALPRHQLFRLFRDWAAERVGSGDAAGETNERVGCMFRGVGEIIWKEVGRSRHEPHFV